MIYAEGENGMDIRAARTLGDFIELSIGDKRGFKAVTLSVQDAFKFARDLIELTKAAARVIGT